MVLQLWSQDQQPQHYLGTCQKCKFLGPTPVILNQTVRVGPSHLCFNKPQVILMHAQAWALGQMRGRKRVMPASMYIYACRSGHSNLQSAKGFSTHNFFWSSQEWGSRPLPRWVNWHPGKWGHTAGHWQTLSLGSLLPALNADLRSLSHPCPYAGLGLPLPTTASQRKETIEWWPFWLLAHSAPLPLPPVRQCTCRTRSSFPGEFNLTRQ